MGYDEIQCALAEQGYDVDDRRRYARRGISYPSRQRRPDPTHIHLERDIPHRQQLLKLMQDEG